MFHRRRQPFKEAPTTGADLLLMAPGVRLQKSQGGGGSPILRGFESNRMLLVVDGVRMNNAIYRSGHLQNAITVDPNSIERVEVIYGASSVGYGSDALGGVVHYYTKTPKINNKETMQSMVSSNFNSAQNAFTSILKQRQLKNWASFPFTYSVLVISVWGKPATWQQLGACKQLFSQQHVFLLFVSYC